MITRQTEESLNKTFSKYDKNAYFIIRLFDFVTFTKMAKFIHQKHLYNTILKNKN